MRPGRCMVGLAGAGAGTGTVAKPDNNTNDMTGTEKGYGLQSRSPRYFK